MASENVARAGAYVFDGHSQPIDVRYKLRYCGQSVFGLLQSATCQHFTDFVGVSSKAQHQRHFIVFASFGTMSKSARISSITVSIFQNKTSAWWWCFVCSIDIHRGRVNNNSGKKTWFAAVKCVTQPHAAVKQSARRSFGHYV